MTNISNTEDVLDVRDIIAQVEELESELEDLPEGSKERDEWSDNNAEDYKALIRLLDNLKGNGGDEQWKGDCYTLPKDLPTWMTITYDYNALQMDYTSVEFDGVTYWYR